MTKIEIQHAWKTAVIITADRAADAAVMVTCLTADRNTLPSTVKAWQTAALAWQTAAQTTAAAAHVATRPSTNRPTTATNAWQTAALLVAHAAVLAASLTTNAASPWPNDFAWKCSCFADDGAAWSAVAKAWLAAEIAASNPISLP